MKATLVGQLPAGDEWLYEIKWDGYRALAVKHGHSVRLLSLKNKNLSGNFPAVVQAVRGFAADTVLIDGEIVAIDKLGCPSFQNATESLPRELHHLFVGRGGRAAAVPFAAIFLYTTVVNIVERPDGVKIASFFIGMIVVTSLLSRVWRATELLRRQGRWR